jgi:serine/threonine protein kinase
VITKEKIRGYAGTPGYTAPEMIKNKPYGPAVDIFSYGVMLYRMLCGAKPFKGKIDRDLDKAVVEREPKFPPDIFSPEATDLLTGVCLALFLFFSLPVVCVSCLVPCCDDYSCCKSDLRSVSAAARRVLRRSRITHSLPLSTGVCLRPATLTHLSFPT